MIARNAWRLVEEPESLWGRSLKAKYFRNTDFIHSKCDGEFINPWCDRWIPEIGSAQPNPNTNPDLNLKVADFIDQDTRDRRAWDLTCDGIFTIKSAYIGLRGNRELHANAIWKEIWRTKVPHRVQIFAWKCAKNAILVRQILSQRINSGDILCPRCNRESETIIHAIVTWPHVSKIWFSSRLNVRTDQFRDKTIDDWLRYWLGINPHLTNANISENFPYVVCLMWAIWNSKNSLIHNNFSEPASSILNRAARMIPSKYDHRVVLNHSRPHNHNLTLPWSPPKSGWMKINTDGAWNSDALEGGMGFVITDSNGTFLFAAALNANFSSAEEPEIRAIWWAMKKAKEMKIKALEIESDAEVVVEQLKKKNFKAQWGKTNATDMFWEHLPIWLLPILGGDQTPYQ
ncbi:Ribonuclease H domain [Macleaya cordata]|uniref:Ribonuclease H domain n=1 Tax=Macleaya cordata TaxID=56857 RepID=A0A200QA78_MACCD|nr:Ribonuclease H domain [Macleaya cordata]